MKHRNRRNDKYYCITGIQQLENDCQKINIRMKKLEDAGLCQVRGMVSMLIEAKNIRRKAQKNGWRTILETTVADSAKEIAR